MKLDAVLGQKLMEQAGPSMPLQDGLKARKSLKAATEFEAILLSSILEKLEQTVSTLPGDSEPSAATKSYTGFAAEALGAAMAQKGGVGFAQMILSGLQSPRQAATEVPANLADHLRDGELPHPAKLLPMQD